uniref:Uncharacterized protein n=1 Tax=Tetraselmis sp. GSL018 TaxID=582737 RepID=A0A061RLV0_9CHLO|eukprot:CAMPEP_0177621236 /NCGR_PEP_ID=MMETSP0419_2-20121207/27459_1 /TAXON_ID=582737 /ORGANISM="Tetraselmis sp., Strain GSL018" /LENGTH=405 /DNA_ID=CAMNT_0019121103 /DNA_START=336 /DNA_END=1553 /DNA_ORIENTATION=-
MSGTANSLLRTSSHGSLGSLSGRTSHWTQIAPPPSNLATEVFYGLRRSHTATRSLAPTSSLSYARGSRNCSCSGASAVNPSASRNFSALNRGNRNKTPFGSQAHSRSCGALTRACSPSGMELCGSWDEEGEREFDSCPRSYTLHAQTGDNNQLRLSGARKEGAAAIQKPPPSGSLPPFQWDLPEIEKGTPAPKRHSALPAWGWEAREAWNLDSPLENPGRSDLSGGVLSWADTVVPPGMDVLDNMSTLSSLNEVFVILFGVGEEGEEGIYSLKSLGGQGVAVDTVIAFESEVDADRYAGLLEAVMVWKPTVHSITPVELVEFVLDSGLDCRLQPRGSHIFPPDWNVPVGMTDWERKRRLRMGQYTVLEADPADGAAPDSGGEPSLLGIGDIEKARAKLEQLYSSS